MDGVAAILALGGFSIVLLVLWTIFDSDPLPARKPAPRKPASSQGKSMAERSYDARRREANIGMALVALMFFGPAVWAIAGAIGHFDTWYYSVFKVMVIAEACILLGIRMSEPGFRNEKMAISTIFVAVLSLICLVSFFSGLPKSVWVVLDIAYAAMQYVLFLGHSEWSRRMITERTGRDPMEGFR